MSISSHLRSAVLAGCCLFLISASPAIRIGFSINAADAFSAEFRIDTDDVQGRHGNWNQRVPLSDLTGYVPGSSHEGPIRFAYVKPAGRISCEGVAYHGRATGDCEFAADERFLASLQSRGIERPTNSQAILLAIGGIDNVLLDALRAGAWPTPTVDELVSLGIFKVTADNIRAFARAGYGGGKIGSLVAFKIHGVSPEMIEEFHAAGFRDLSASDLLAFRIHGVSAEFAKQWKNVGYAHLNADQLIKLKIFGITPDYGRTMSNRSDKKLSVDQLVKLRLAGMRPEDLRP